MIKKWTTALTALAFAATAAAPPAFADRHDYRGHGGSYRHGHYYHHDGDAAVAAGAIGLVLGLALGAALSDPPPPRARCYDNYQRCEPPRRYSDAAPPSDYQGTDPRDDRRSAYEQDYGDAPQGQAADQGDDELAGGPSTSCVHPMQHWDPYSGRYVWVNVRSC